MLGRGGREKSESYLDEDNAVSLTIHGVVIKK